MGIYLNPGNDNFRKFVSAGIYVDKTNLIKELNLLIDNPARNFVCVSRPRRFGKTLAEDMLVAYYSKGADSKELFLPYKIAQAESFETFLNKYNVIHIDLNAFHSSWITFSDNEKPSSSFIGFIAEKVCKEFVEQFSDVSFPDYYSLSEYIQTVYATKKQTFIIIIDEYDCLVRESVAEEEFNKYLAFLNSLFKNSNLRSAISLAYITGILPIIRDKIQSKLNTFEEYTIVNPGSFAEYTGFTTEEVQELCKKNDCSFEECKSWYDGYKLKNIEVYNPQSIMKAITNKQFKSYWSATSTYTVVEDKISMNFDGIRDDVITMLAGGKIDVNVEKYENRMNVFNSKDDIFTFLIYLGYLAYDADEQVCYIPNREIHKEWQNAISDNSDYSETNKIIAQSKLLLKETLAGNEKAVEQALDISHIHVTSNKSYNNEESLQSAIYLAYIYALNDYIIQKEATAGKGFADIIYIPLDKSKPAFIVELKHNKSADSALNQIKQKQYAQCLANWHGDLLFVGINYDEKSKKHSCRIEKVVM